MQSYLRSRRRGCLAAIFLSFPILTAPIGAGDRKTASPIPAIREPSTIADQLAKSRHEWITATREYRSSLEKLLALHEEEGRRATQKVEGQKKLVEEGLIAKLELQDSEYARSQSQAKMESVLRQIAEADHLMAEIQTEEPAIALGESLDNGARIYYIGPATWSLVDSEKIKDFFAARFGRPLPVSAYGQTAAHDRLGFDHRHALDVAVHPDSAEGQALLAYLRRAGIAFIAFRQGVPGAATGAHIHIGKPSLKNAS